MTSGMHLSNTWFVCFLILSSLKFLSASWFELSHPFQWCGLLIGSGIELVFGVSFSGVLCHLSAGTIFIISTIVYFSLVIGQKNFGIDDYNCFQ